jgi:pimeloyl-ACP methyl ester carboxylesterase
MSFPLGDIAFKRISREPGRPTLIFLHDSLGCIDLWRDFPEQLGARTNCSVLIYDRQGYGKSCPFSSLPRRRDYMEQEADLLPQLMDHWQIGKAILFGHSDGGSIALLAAARHPERISGIITEGAHIFVEELTLKGIHEAMQVYESTDLKRKLEKYHGDKTDAMFGAWAHTWTREDFRNWNIEASLPSIQCPALIIQGEDDEYGTPAQVAHIVQNAGGPAEAWMIPGVKHSPHKEVPELVLGRSAAFIHSLEKRP